jgi:hypothetical protein
MRYRRNKGGVYGAGIGLLALLVCVAIGMWMFSTTATVTTRSHKNAREALDQVLEVGQRVSDQAYEANRDPSARRGGDEAANTAAPGEVTNSGVASNDGDGLSPVSPAASNIVTPPVNASPSPATTVKKIAELVPRQMPDHGVGKLIEEME